MTKSWKKIGQNRQNIGQKGKIGQTLDKMDKHWKVGQHWKIGQHWEIGQNWIKKLDKSW